MDKFFVYLSRTARYGAVAILGAIIALFAFDIDRQEGVAYVIETSCDRPFSHAETVDSLQTEMIQTLRALRAAEKDGQDNNAREARERLTDVNERLDAAMKAALADDEDNLVKETVRYWDRAFDLRMENKRLKKAIEVALIQGRLDGLMLEYGPLGTAPAGDPK